MKILFPLAHRGRRTHLCLPISCADFVRTALGRAALHLECLCHHPAAARFHFAGLTRNLGEGIRSLRQSAWRWLTANSR